MQKLSAIRNVLVVSLITVPLLVLMVKNLGRAAAMGGAPAAAGAGEVNKTDDRSLIEDTKSRVAAQGPALQALGDAQLFGDRPLPNVAVPRIDPAFWTRLTKAHDAVERLAKIYRGPGPPDPESEIKALEPLTDDQVWEGLAEAQPLQEWVAKRIKSLSTKIESRDLLAEARKALEEKRYTTCQAELKKIDKSGLSPEQARDADLWERQCAFELHWKKVYKGDLAAQARELEKLLEQSPEPYDADSTAKLAERKAELNTMQVKLRELELFQSPPELPELLAKCRALVQDDPAILPKVRASFRGWLQERIVELPPRPNDRPEVKEAWMKNKPERLEGVFERVGLGTDRDPRYKLWELKDWLAKATRGQRYKDVYLSDLEGEPQRPVESRVIEEYNLARKDLFKKLDADGSWKGFHDKAAALQEDLDRYYLRMANAPSQRISLETAVGVARAVLDDWRGAREILATK